MNKYNYAILKKLFLNFGYSLLTHDFHVEHLEGKNETIRVKQDLLKETFFRKLK